MPLAPTGVRAAAFVPLLAALAIAVVVADRLRGGAAADHPGAGRRDPGRAARGQPHRQGLLFLPDTLDLVPGETVLLHVINGGLEIHEAVIGDGAVQEAWERAEAATVGGPPGPTPVVSVPPEVAGLRVVVRSGERVDVRWTVPDDVGDASAPTAGPSGATSPATWRRGCRSRSAGSPRPQHEGAGWYAFVPAAG